MNVLQKQIAALPTEDDYDTAALAQDHLENADALFNSILLLLDKHDYKRAHKLAMLGHEQAADAVDHFHNQLQILDARDAE